jgi:hypothetical protein
MTAPTSPQTPADIRRAERAIDDATRYLTAYIFRQIAEAGNDYKLSEKTGIPRTTIQATMRTGGILALRKLAYKLAAAKAKQSISATCRV